MKAIVWLDVPEWQIGSEVTVYFKDTMVTKGVCEKAPEQRFLLNEDGKIIPLNPYREEPMEAKYIGHEDYMVWECPVCKNPTQMFSAGEQIQYCAICGQRLTF